MKMAYFQSIGAKIMDKFHAEKFSLWKYKMEMVLTFMDLWDIVDPKVLKEYQMRVKKAMSIIDLNLADNQLAHTKSCKRQAEVWKTRCSIHELQNLSNIFFVSRKFFMCKMHKGVNVLDHVNKVKVLADELVYLELPVREKNIVITLFESLPALYEYLVINLETMLMKKLMI